MWWAYILIGFYVLTCVVLITAVLLQPGKADAAALFGGGASQTAFGPRGAQNVLGWTTWVAAGLMVLLALILSLPRVFGPQSVVSGGATVPVQQQPTIPAPASAPAQAATSPATSQAPASQSGSQPAATPAPAPSKPSSSPASPK